MSETKMKKYDETGMVAEVGVRYVLWEMYADRIQ